MKTRIVIVVCFAVCSLALSACRGGDSSIVPHDSAPAKVNSIAPHKTVAAASMNWQDVGPVFLRGNASYPTGRSGKLQAFATTGGASPLYYVAGGFGRGQEIATDAGVFRSADLGNTWTRVDRGLSDTVVNDVWASPKKPGVVLAATEFGGIFRSVDAGEHWSNVDSTPDATNFAFTGSQLYVTDETGIKVSADRGATWRLAEVTQAPANAIAYGGGALYAGDVANNVYALNNGHWHSVTKIAASGNNMGVHAIAIDPLNPQKVYVTLNAIITTGKTAATAGSQQLHDSSDGGSTWRLTPVPSNFYGEQMLSMGAVDPQTVYVGAEFRGLSSTNGGNTWQPVPSTGDQRGLYLYQNGSVNACFVPSDQGLFYFSTCGNEATLTSLTQGISNNYVTAFAVAGNTIMAALQDFTYAASTDGGSLWFKPPFSGASQLVHENGDAAINPRYPRFCYSLTARGYDFSKDGCNSFASDETLSNGGGKPSGDDIAFDPQHGSRVYIIASQNSGPSQIFFSDNAGQSMKPSGWPLTDPSKIYVDPTDGQHIFVSEIAGGIPRLALTRTGAPPFKVARGLAYPAAVAVDPAQPSIVLAADTSANLYRSSDGGNSFRLLRAKLPGRSTLHVDRRRAAIIGLHGEDEGGSGGGQATTTYPTHLRFSGGNKPFVVLTTLHGAWLSPDAGSTWQRLDTGGATISHIFSDAQWVGGALYLSTYGQGIIKTSEPLQ